MQEDLKHIIELAIAFEKESYHFYTALKKNTKNPQLTEILDQLANAEIGHRRKLENILKRGTVEGEKIFRELQPKQVKDMKLSDHLLPARIDSNSTFQEIMIAAMHREKGAHDFYKTMTKLAATDEARNLFEFLAAEELEHKGILERLYEDEIYTEF